MKQYFNSQKFISKFGLNVFLWGAVYAVSPDLSGYQIMVFVFAGALYLGFGNQS